MASFFAKLFGGGASGDAPKAAQTAEPHHHGDYTIYATPMKEGGQYRLAGRIEKTVGEEKLVHDFVRADVFTNLDDAVECTVRKAKLIIDQSGTSLFPTNK